jgi:hypothetical protein
MHLMQNENYISKRQFLSLEPCIPHGITYFFQGRIQDWDPQGTQLGAERPK